MQQHAVATQFATRLETRADHQLHREGACRPASQATPRASRLLRQERPRFGPPHRAASSDLVLHASD